MVRGLFDFIEQSEIEEKDLTQRSQRKEESVEEREDEEITLAGEDDGEGAAIGGDGEIAEGEVVKNGDWRGLRDGNFVIRGDRRERREIDPD
jgi:hypothetical protein